MSRLRRAGTGDLRPPHLGPYPDTTFQIWEPHLTCPGTSSPGTALFSSLLDQALADRVRDGVRAVAQLEAGGEVVQDVLDRPLAVAEGQRDLTGVVAVGDELEHLGLARRQPGE